MQLERSQSRWRVYKSVLKRAGYSAATNVGGRAALERLVEQRLALGVGATLLHVREVGLVRLVAQRLRRVVGVEARGKPARGNPTPRGSRGPRRWRSWGS